mmetsp:Transcript_37478/g.76440  ORF Transcript_37478/g.76440 Transcript_37478/m.76440 type:complete len:168 (-) Transcript_37478:304-807(-)
MFPNRISSLLLLAMMASSYSSTQVHDKKGTQEGRLRGADMNQARRLEECFDCDAQNPCANAAETGDYYYPHCELGYFVQCGANGGCFKQGCPDGLVWNDSAGTCDVPCFICSSNSPCTDANIGAGKYYHSHCSPTNFIQCDDSKGCHEMACPAGLVWKTDIDTCGTP